MGKGRAFSRILFLLLSLLLGLCKNSNFKETMDLRDSTEYKIFRKAEKEQWVGYLPVHWADWVQSLALQKSMKHCQSDSLSHSRYDPSSTPTPTWKESMSYCSSCRVNYRTQICITCKNIFAFVLYSAVLRNHSWDQGPYGLSGIKARWTTVLFPQTHKEAYFKAWTFERVY